MFNEITYKKNSTKLVAQLYINTCVQFLYCVYEITGD